MSNRLSISTIIRHFQEEFKTDAEMQEYTVRFSPYEYTHIPANEYGDGEIIIPFDIISHKHGRIEYSLEDSDESIVERLADAIEGIIENDED